MFHELTAGEHDLTHVYLPQIDLVWSMHRDAIFRLSRFADRILRAGECAQRCLKVELLHSRRSIGIRATHRMKVTNSVCGEKRIFFATSISTWQAIVANKPASRQSRPCRELASLPIASSPRTFLGVANLEESMSKEVKDVLESSHGPRNVSSRSCSESQTDQ